MNIPLIAMSSNHTVNRMTGEQQIIVWVDGEKRIVKSPRSHHYYIPDNEGEEQKVLGHGVKKYTKKYVSNAKELHPETIPSYAKLDGVTNNEIERICIEKPEFFKGYPQEKVKSLGFDLEVTSADGSFPLGEKHPIVAIGYVTSDGDRKSLLWNGETDKQIIEEFADFINEYDPDVIYGYNVIGYDIPQLFARAKRHNINLKPKLNRENNPSFGWETDFSYHKKTRIQTWGRVIIDVYNFTSRDYALAGIRKRLKDVARFYGHNPIELDFAEKDILDYDIETVNEYVLSDCDITKWLFEHYFLQHQYIAETLGVPLELYINSADSFITKILQGRDLYRKNILTLDKNIDRYPETKSFQAAHIDLYLPGFHKENYKVDFASMYPSIAMTLNLGPDTTTIEGYEDYDISAFNCTFKQNAMYLTIPDNVINKNVIIKVDQSFKSGLYTMCKNFNNIRKPFKKLKTHEAKSKSNGIKIMVNTFYGANTNPYMTYGDISVGIAITGVARWLIMGAKKLIEMKYGDNSVVYIHTDGINTNKDIDTDWINKQLQKGVESFFTGSEPEWVKVDKDVFKEGVWLQIGNYVLRNEDGSLTKHGSTFKAKTRSPFYLKVLKKITMARLDNVVNADFVEDLYDFDNFVLEDFLQTRAMNRNIEDYVGENDLIVQLAKQGKKLGMRTGPGTTFYYYKTKEGYKVEESVESLSEIDIKYHWDIINNLLKKFSLESWVRKKPNLTVVDRNQQSLLEFV